ncbi:acetylornithine aminotransferase mitochondrial-like, partial [Trifolium medium]|nr:acetylornithine aminotransferase mitochondrial-like [Trifolium medium]
MSAVQICLNHSISQSPYKLSQFFNSERERERENNLVRRRSVIRTNFRRDVVTACLNVDVSAANAGKIALEKTKEMIGMEGKFLVGTYARVPAV